MSIYTKRGDKGKTDLFDSYNLCKIRVFKDDNKIQAIGSIDELNSSIGIVINLVKDKEEIIFLRKIQKDLFLINAYLAGAKNISFSKNKVNYLEKKIDFLEKGLPKLKNFIFPGGSLISSFMHFARSITRRVERNIVTISKENKINPNILIFINRLSDLLFVMARWNNKTSGVDELIWKK
jgi:cob(I)alamin adenosyltransferase